MMSMADDQTALAQHTICACNNHHATRRVSRSRPRERLLVSLQRRHQIVAGCTRNEDVTEMSKGGVVYTFSQQKQRICGSHVSVCQTCQRTHSICRYHKKHHEALHPGGWISQGAHRNRLEQQAESIFHSTRKTRCYKFLPQGSAQLALRLSHAS